MLVHPKAEDLLPEAVLSYPTAVDWSPSLKLQIPTAVLNFPTVDVATTVPVIAPVVVFKVAPDALFRIPIPTEARPPVLEKFSRPNVWEFRASEMFSKPTAVVLVPDAVLQYPKADDR